MENLISKLPRWLFAITFTRIGNIYRRLTKSKQHKIDIKNILISGSIMFVFGCSVQNEDKTLQFIEVSSRGYSQSVEVNCAKSKTVYISGQVPVDNDGKVVEVGDLEKQTEQVFKNIKLLVEISGGTMDDLVNIDCYFTDISRISEFRKARDKYINSESPPASTAVQVERFINKDFLIEINAIAVIKNTNP